MLIEKGDQVPLIPSFDLSGSTGGKSFRQYESATVGKVGVMVVAMVMFIVVGMAQLPADEGVNWYVAVPRTDVLMLAGLQVPVIPSFDVSGSTGGVEL